MIRFNIPRRVYCYQDLKKYQNQYNNNYGESNTIEESTESIMVDSSDESTAISSQESITLEDIQLPAETIIPEEVEELPSNFISEPAPISSCMLSPLEVQETKPVQTSKVNKSRYPKITTQPTVYSHYKTEPLPTRPTLPQIMKPQVNSLNHTIPKLTLIPTYTVRPNPQVTNKPNQRDLKTAINQSSTPQGIKHPTNSTSKTPTPKVEAEVEQKKPVSSTPFYKVSENQWWLTFDE